MGLQQHGPVSSSDMLQEIAQTLRPEDRCGLRRFDEAHRIDVVAEFKEHARHPVHAPAAMHVSDEIDRRRLHGGDHDRAARIDELSTGTAASFRRATKATLSAPHVIPGRFLSSTTWYSCGR